MGHGTEETEIKLRVPDVRTARGILRASGFRVAKRRLFESNTVFDTPELTLRNKASLLRVREAGSKAKLTYKGRPGQSKHKSREELEIEVSDAGAMSAILERIGFHPAFRYEKYRTELQPRGGGGVATLDETPIGVFLELEGPPAWIDRAARKLGFRESDYITDSYGRLYLEWCRERNIGPSDMVFR